MSSLMMVFRYNTTQTSNLSKTGKAYCFLALFAKGFTCRYLHKWDSMETEGMCSH